MVGSEFEDWPIYSIDRGLEAFAQHHTYSLNFSKAFPETWSTIIFVLTERFGSNWLCE